jgi:hypothetical protein
VRLRTSLEYLEKSFLSPPGMEPRLLGCPSRRLVTVQTELLRHREELHNSKLVLVILWLQLLDLLVYSAFN